MQYSDIPIPPSPLPHKVQDPLLPGYFATRGERSFCLPALIITLVSFALCTAAAVCGGLIAGIPWEYLSQLPPENTRVAHHALNHELFVLCLFLVIILGTLTQDLLSKCGALTLRTIVTRAYFPFWGYAALCGLLLFWAAAWLFIDKESNWRYFTFSGIWYCYIVIASAWHYRIAGWTPLTNNPLRFFLLFPLSAIFWWCFELINRIVENWAYTGIDEISSLGYLAFASLSFSTVLPAMLITKLVIEEYLAPPAPQGLNETLPDWLWLTTVLFGLTSLFLLAQYPTELYPFVWIAPALVVPALQRLAGQHCIYSDWSRAGVQQLLLWALAGLVCGFFWEMWNSLSAAKWTYSVSYVSAFHIFEMPLLGYLGYIPFGFLCGALLQSVDSNYEVPAQNEN